MNLTQIRHLKLRNVFDHVDPKYVVDWPWSLVVDIDVSDRMARLCEVATEYLEISEHFEYANLTPNGMLMPKVENVGLYTAFARGFFNIVRDLDIWKYFSAWNVPAIRYKSALPQGTGRPRASENIHSDEWLGWDSGAIVFMIPLAGDVLNNGVRFFSHPLDKSWLAHQTSFNTDAARLMAQQAKPLDCGYDIGHIYPNDISVLHQTFRNPGCGARLSAEIVGYVGTPHRNSFGAHTAFGAGLAGGLADGIRHFKAHLKMGEIGEYSETGRALDVEIV